MASPSSLLFSLTAASLFTYGHAFWREACSVVQTGRIDPILSPDAVSGHVHKLSGASNVNWYSDNATIQESSCTSCEVQDDRSAYWSPQLYYAHSNGTFEEVPNYGMTVYFLAPTPAGDTTPVVAFPPGFKMISGNAGLRAYNSSDLTWDGSTPIADAISFHCIDSSDPNLAEEPYMFKTDCDNGMRAQVLFQSCWDGVNTYLPGSAHVAYQTEIGNGGCPSTHPVVLPLLFYEVLYWTIDIDQSAGGEFTFAQGDATGYGFHGDFLNGWNQDVLENAVENCLTLVDNPDGTVSTCAALAPSDDVNFPRDCPEQPSFVPEPVSGLLDHLPGCNTPSSGPDSVAQVVCQVDTETPVSSQVSADAASPYTSTSGTYSSATAVATPLSTVSFEATGSSSAFQTSTLSSSSNFAASTSSSNVSTSSSLSDFAASTSSSGVITSSSAGSFLTLSASFPNTTAIAADATGPFSADATESSTSDVTTTPTPITGVYTSTVTMYVAVTALFPSSTAATATTTEFPALQLPSSTPTDSSFYSTTYTTVYVTVSSPFASNTTSTTSLFQNNTAIATNIGIPAQYYPTDTTAPYSYFNTTAISTTDSVAAAMTSATFTVTEVFDYSTTTFTSTATYPIYYLNTAAPYNTTLSTVTQAYAAASTSAYLWSTASPYSWPATSSYSW